MIGGAVIGFIIWAFIVVLNLATLQPLEVILYRKITLAFVLLVGTGASAGYLFS